LRDHRDLAAALSRSSEEPQVVSLSVETARRTPDIDAAAFYLLEPQTGDFVLAGADGASVEFDAADARLPAGSRRVEWLKTVSAFHDRPTAVPLAAIEEPAMAREGLTALSVIPMRHGDVVFGCLYVGSRSLARLPLATCDAVEAIASMAGEAVIRARAEVRERTSDERLRVVFETMDQGVVFQEADGRISTANPAACRILGLPLD